MTVCEQLLAQVSLLAGITATSSSLASRAASAEKACSLFILDKGKPVVRPGRKAKGR
jgi:hypothetical protein